MLSAPAPGGKAGAEILTKRPRFRGTRTKQDLKGYARMLVDAGLTWESVIGAIASTVRNTGPALAAQAPLIQCDVSRRLVPGVATSLIPITCAGRELSIETGLRQIGNPACRSVEIVLSRP
jgi:hypothetical protein